VKLLIVYDTAQENCAKLHKLLKRYLFWNQRSCFEGRVTEAQLFEIRAKIKNLKAEGSHVCYYLWRDERTFAKIEEGDPVGYTSNHI